MRFLYDIFFILFAVVYIPVMLLRKRSKGDLFQKIGILPGEVAGLEAPVWIHAVSVGEAAVAARLASGLKKKHPNVPVVVSTTTATGNEMVRKLGKNVVDAVFYYPVDISFVVDRVIDIIGPRMYLMVETELWPNLLRGMKVKKVPVALVNGRISENSYSGYMKFRVFIKKILDDIDLFCMQSERDRERIIDIGADSEKTVVTGSMKFDDAADVSVRDGIGKRQIGISVSSILLVAGSTHDPEERLIIDMFAEISPGHPELKLVVAPRHIERCGAVKIYLEKAGFRCALYSRIQEGGGLKDLNGTVILVDTIGHLRGLYSAADIVFIGGSIADKGGQNPIEAAMWGKPVIFGSNMDNFIQVSEILVSGGGAVQVENTRQLQNTLEELLADGKTRMKMGANARKVVVDNAGATERTVASVTRNII